MIEWKRIKAGEYKSNDGRFIILKHLTQLYNEWYLYDYHKAKSYHKPTYSDCKMTADAIVKKEKETNTMNELQVQCLFYFKTKENNIDDAMKEVYDALNKAGIEMGDTSHVVLRDNEDGVIYERGW